jgi:hypothetical protein
MTFVLSTVRQTIHFGLCTALITKAKALRSNCKCIAKLAVDQTWRILYSVHQKQLRKQSSSFFLKEISSETANAKVGVLAIYYIISSFFQQFILLHVKGGLNLTNLFLGINYID